MSASPSQSLDVHGVYRWGALAIVVVVAGIWELSVRTQLVSAMFLPAPSAILRELALGLWGGSLRTALGATAVRVTSGLLIGGAVGALLGLLMGASRRLGRLLNPLVAAVHPIPKLAMLPLFMVFFGLGETPKVIVVSAAAFFPMLLSTMAGVRHIASVHFDAARTYGASRSQLIRHVVIPGSVPMMISGFRLAANIAFLSAIAVEMVSAKNGLGAEVWLAWQVLRLEHLFATLVVIAAAGVTVNATLRALSPRVAPWLTAREVTI
jgi:ABC-type nitrate/sulfonate/bicarbonate transport system permease component